MKFKTGDRVKAKDGNQKGTVEGYRSIAGQKFLMVVWDGQFDAIAVSSIMVEVL